MMFSGSVHEYRDRVNPSVTGAMMRAVTGRP
jgi:hypothetical protein